MQMRSVGLAGQEWRPLNQRQYPCVPNGLRPTSPGCSRMTRSWWSTPATPECGWVASTTSVFTQGYLRSAGHLGWAFPASLGAKCASPDRPVVCFTGDSGFWYHVAEIETAVRFGINTITVVNDNHSGNQSMPGFDRVYGGKQTEQARELWHFTDVDFARLAEDIGGWGFGSRHPVDSADDGTR